MILLRGAPGAGKTSVAQRFASRFDRWDIVEVDDVKVEQHGTAEHCVPAQDFPEAGRRARAALDAGRRVIGVEFFNDRDLIDLFLDPTGLTVERPELNAVWLDCDVQAAVRRKRGQVPERSVRTMHAAVPLRFVIPGETAIDTTHLTIDQVVERVVVSIAAREVPAG